MSNQLLIRFAACLLLLLGSGLADAHPGRRFEVQVINNQLVAQGVNTLEKRPMGEQPKRPYPNVIHDHFTNMKVNNEPLAVANLPGFDIPAELRALHGSRVTLRVDKVVEISRQSISSSTPIADSMLPVTAPGKLTIAINDGVVSTDGLPGELTLADVVLPQGNLDLDPTFQANFAPTDSFVAVAVTLSTTSPAIRPSAPIWIVLAPPGHQFHEIALRLEARLAREMGDLPDGGR